MLPESYHAEVCKLLCTWLGRLEERDRKHGSNDKPNTTKKLEDADTGNKDQVTNRSTMPDLPTSKLARAKEKRLRRNAAG